MTAAASTVDHGRAVLILSASGFAASVNLRAMDTLLPGLADDFGVTVGQASAVITAYALGYGCCQLAIGLVGDRFGKYRLIFALCLLSAFASAVASLAVTLGQLTAARLFAGAAAAGIVPLALAWIGDKVPVAERQTVMARYMMGTITGGLMGQVIGGILTEHFGWRAALLAFAACFLVVAGALAWGARFTGVDAPAAAPPRNPLAQVLKLVGNRYAYLVLGAVVLEGVAVFGVLAFAGASLHDRFGIDLGTVGLILAFFALGGIVYTSLVGRLIRRFRPARLMAVGGPVMAVGFLALGLSPALWSMPLAIALMGFGFYLVHNPLQFHATQIMPDARGTGVAFFATCLFVAQSAGVALVAPVVDVFGLLPACLVSAAAMAIATPLIARRLSWR